MKVLISAAILGIFVTFSACSNEAKFAGRTMPVEESPVASPVAAIQTAADANVQNEMPSGDVSDTVSLTSSAGAGGSVSPSSGSHKIGAIVNLMANSKSGYAFSSWGGDCAGKGSTCSLTMNANKAATAYFSCAGDHYSTGGTCQLIPTCRDNSSWNGSSSCVCNSGYLLINGTCQLPSNWVDVTTPGSASLTMMDTRTKLKWTNRRPDATWQGAIDHCSALTYNGVSGWRLPSVSELHDAFHAPQTPWMVQTNYVIGAGMNIQFWSANSITNVGVSVGEGCCTYFAGQKYYVMPVVCVQ